MVPFVCGLLTFPAFPEFLERLCYRRHGTLLGESTGRIILRSMFDLSPLNKFFFLPSTYCAIDLFRCFAVLHFPLLPASLKTPRGFVLRGDLLPGTRSEVPDGTEIYLVIQRTQDEIMFRFFS